MLLLLRGMISDRRLPPIFFYWRSTFRFFFSFILAAIDVVLDALSIAC
jgi:hypothetical protein